jgi:hypothetical protein
MANPCHSQPTHAGHTPHDSADHHAALISADSHISAGCDCNPALASNIHADVLPCGGGLAYVHHDEHVVGINIDPDYHV